LAEADYHCGYRNLFEELLRALYLGEEDHAVELFERWHSILQATPLCDPASARQAFTQFSDRISPVAVYQETTEWVHSKYMDLVPQNMLFHPVTKDNKVIDLEWDIAPCPIPLQFAIDRGSSNC
jgi:hypothetical protein